MSTGSSSAAGAMPKKGIAVREGGEISARCQGREWEKGEPFLRFEWELVSIDQRICSYGG